MQQPPYIFKATLYNPYQWGISQGLAAGATGAPAAAVAPAAAAGATAPLASAAATFSQHPHYPHPSAAPYSHLHYSEFYRHRPRCGPRFFPLLLVGGAGVWGYHHLKHTISDLRDDQDALRSVVASSMAPGAAAAVVEPVAHRRRRWGRWEDRERDPTPRVVDSEPKRMV